MLRTTLTVPLVVLVMGVLPAHAAPTSGPDISHERTIDRWVELRDPGQLVGPQIDPTGPLKDVKVSEPEPEPWREIPQVKVRTVGH